mgnify:FL=1
MNLQRIEISNEGATTFYKVDAILGVVFKEPLPLGTGSLLFVPTDERERVLTWVKQAAALSEQPERKPAARSDAILAWDRTLKHFIGKHQWSAIKQGMAGEERQYFYDMMVDLAARIEAMPKTYEQDGKGDQAIVHLHYFRGGCDWWISEKDSDPDGEGQIQAFGYANLGDDQNAELGYISIKELIEHGVELDLYWTPKTLEQVKAKRRTA